MENNLIATRRFYHKIAEPGWMEFKTTINIIKDLKNIGVSDIKISFISPLGKVLPQKIPLLCTLVVMMAIYQLG